MVDNKRKFTQDLAKGKTGEGEFMKRLTKYSPNGNWISYNDFDTDIRSHTHGVIEVKTETSTTRKVALKYKGQILPRHQWFCVNYARKRKNKEYPDKPAALRRGVWKTARDAKYWAERNNNPKLKGLYVKQWVRQTCDSIALERP